MSGTVKSERPYVSTRRVQQAEATRRAILEAALRLFTERGYASSTIEDVAGAAQVAVPTVYKTFRTKRALLERLVDSVMAGDPRARNLVEQDWWREQINEPDARRQLELIARNARRIYERSGGLLRAVRDAAGSDPEIANLWGQISKRRRDRARITARSLRKKAGVNRRSTAGEAADVLWSLTAPEIHGLLVGEAGWTADHYEAWLAEALKALLLS